MSRSQSPGTGRACACGCLFGNVAPGLAMHVQGQPRLGGGTEEDPSYPVMGLYARYFSGHDSLFTAIGFVPILQVRKMRPGGTGLSSEAGR